MAKSVYGMGTDVRAGGLRSQTAIGARRPRGGSAGLVGNLAQNFQSAYDEARSANVGRFEEIKGEYSSLYDRVMAAEDARSTQGEADIRGEFADIGAREQQSFVDRGLYNTSAATGAQTATDRAATEAVNRFRDTGIDRRSGYDIGLTGERLGFIERREDEYPNSGLLASLAQAVGAAGPGGLPPEMISLYEAMLGQNVSGTGGGIRGSQYAPTTTTSGGRTPAGGRVTRRG